MHAAAGREQLPASRKSSSGCVLPPLLHRQLHLVSAVELVIPTVPMIAGAHRQHRAPCEPGFGRQAKRSGESREQAALCSLARQDAAAVDRCRWGMLDLSGQRDKCH